MRNLFVVTLLLVLVAGLALAQSVVSDKLYRVPMVASESDTIPGTETGGAGAGGCGWLFIGSNGVEITTTCQDSANSALWVDYADSGYAAATGRSAYSVGFVTCNYARTAQDSIVAIANEAAPKSMISRVFRDRGQGVDLIPGARYIRIRVVGHANKQAGTAASRTLSVRVRQFKYSGT